MGKKVFYDADARQRVLAGAEILYNAVKTTMGPKGRNVLIAKNYGPGIVTHDGATVARAVELSEEDETLGLRTGADLVRSVAIKMEKLAGDGTTTVTVLTYHILNEAHKLMAAGYNPMIIRKSLEVASEEILKALKDMAEDISEDSKKVAEIATISAGDPVIGAKIAEVIKAVGKDGVVTVEEGQSFELESEIVKGFTFDNGYVSPYFVNDQARMEASLENPLVLLTDSTLNNMQALLPLIEQVAQAGRKELLIIADDIEGEVLQTLVLNNLKGTFHTLCVKAPSFGDARKDILNDLAILTKATLVTEDQGYNLGNITIEFLGQCKKVISTKEDTTIIEGFGAVEDIDNRIASIKKQRENATSEYDKERFDNRAAALGGKVAIIKVGGVTETEIEEKKFRVDDAVAAVKAALAEGIVPGGGVTLVNLAADLVIADKTADGSAGRTILYEALHQPFNTLLKNAGIVPEEWLHQLRGTKGQGIDVNDPSKLIDLKKHGIVDPAQVTREAIQNAVSMAGVMMTMGALVVEEKADEVAAPAGPPIPGMR
jgi:chaperonin GroEL